MAIYRRHLILFVFFFPALIGAAFGQIGERTASIEFTVFAQQPLDNVFFMAEGGGAPTKLAFYSQSKSPVYRYKGPSTLRFFRQDASAGQPSGASPKITPLATYVIPQETAKLTLFFFGNPNAGAANSLPYMIFGADDSLERVPRGHVIVLNASGRIYAADFGDNRPITLSIGLSNPVAVGQSVSLRLATQVNQEWVRAGSRTFSFGQNTRGTLVLFPPLENGGIAPNIRQLFEDLPPEDIRGKVK